MEVFACEDSIILTDGNRSLWFTKSNITSKDNSTLSTETLPKSPSRSPIHGQTISSQTAIMIPKISVSIDSVPNTVFLGVCYGVIGKFRDSKLIVIRDRELVGYFPGPGGQEHEVFKVKGVSILDPWASNESPVDLDQCYEETNMEHTLDNKYKTSSRPGSASKMAKKTWNSMKTVTGSVIKTGGKMVVSKASNLTQMTTGTAVNADQDTTIDSRDRLEKRLLDELVKMFTETDSFYYSPTGDLTNSIQRKFSHSECNGNDVKNDWKSLDDRFFWNKVMLSDLINFPEENLSKSWILPVIQGYFQYERCPHHDAFSFSNVSSSSPVTFSTTSSSSNKELTNLKTSINNNNKTGDESCDNNMNKQSSSPAKECQPVMILISRRSRFRAGTRYKRRGVDEEGFVGNYVETEQIFKYNKHVVSFVQVRGSIPLFWSQVGSSYRPPPKMDRSEAENQESFKKHFEKELSIYDKQIIVNLVEASGRERILHEAYLNHVLTLDSPYLTYVSFDFHDYCRGMKFENVSVLIESLCDVIKEMKFSWVDDQGVICTQEGVFRVNCVDCLDRTNIVETAIARTVMDLQFTRLGLLPPEGSLPSSWRNIFQSMWANNGDVISKQYAGTNALKSDFTRTGKTKLSGMVKDSYNSATRYYQNRFRDGYRQAVIDLMTGVESKEPFMLDANRTDEDEDEDEDDSDRHERVKQVIEDVKKLLIPETEVILGGWPLIDCDPSTPGVISRDMDTVLILTQEAYFVSDYDEVTDRVTRCQKVLLEDMEKIELGLEPTSVPSISSKGRQSSSSASYCIRLFYLVQGQSGYFHMFKSTGTRFFNNMAIAVKSREDEMESLKAIVESFKVALSVKCLSVPLFEGRLDRKKSRTLQSHRNPFAVTSEASSSASSLKSVGSKALSGMSSLLPISKIKGKFKPAVGSGSLGSSIAGSSLASSAATFVSYTVGDSVGGDDYSSPKQHSQQQKDRSQDDIMKMSQDVKETAGKSESLQFHGSNEAMHQLISRQQNISQQQQQQHDNRLQSEQNKQKGSSSGEDIDDYDIDVNDFARNSSDNRRGLDSSEASDYSASIFVKEGDEVYNDDAFDEDSEIDEEGLEFDNESVDDNDVEVSNVYDDNEEDDETTPVPGKSHFIHKEQESKQQSNEIRAVHNEGSDSGQKKTSSIAKCKKSHELSFVTEGEKSHPKRKRHPAGDNKSTKKSDNNLAQLPQINSSAVTMESNYTPVHLPSCGILSTSPSPPPVSTLKGSLSEADIEASGVTSASKDSSGGGSSKTTGQLTSNHLPRLSASRQAMHGTDEIKNEEKKRIRQQQHHESFTGSHKEIQGSSSERKPNEDRKENILTKVCDLEPKITCSSRDEAFYSLPSRPDISVTSDDLTSLSISSTSANKVRNETKTLSNENVLQTTVSMINVNIGQSSPSGEEAKSKWNLPTKVSKDPSSGATFFLGSHSNLSLKCDDHEGSGDKLHRDSLQGKRSIDHSRLLDQSNPNVTNKVTTGPSSHLTVSSASTSSMKNSRSANEMMSLMRNTLTTASSGTADLVLNPLTKIAKGVQSLGIHSNPVVASYQSMISPGSLSPSGSSVTLNTGGVVSPRKQKQMTGLLDSYDEMKRRKRSSKTRIIEL